MEWVSEIPPGSPRVVVWRPDGAGAGEDVPAVVTSYVSVRESGGRYRVRSLTTYMRGEWAREEPGSVSGEAYGTKQMADAWARRMAEAEAGNRHAISWDGEVPA